MKAHAYGSDAHLRSLIDAAKAFFATNPTRKLYAAFVGVSEVGAWDFIIFDAKRMVGEFGFTPPNESMTREQFQYLLNTLPKGEEMLTEWVAQGGERVRSAHATAMEDILRDAPASPTRH